MLLLASAMFAEHTLPATLPVCFPLPCWIHQSLFLATLGLRVSWPSMFHSLQVPHNDVTGPHNSVLRGSPMAMASLY